MVTYKLDQTATLLIFRCNYEHNNEQAVMRFLMFIFALLLDLLVLCLNFKVVASPIVDVGLNILMML